MFKFIGFLIKDVIKTLQSERGDFGGEEPEAPTFQIPDWAKNLPPEILQYIRQGVGGRLAEPQEYALASQTIQDLLRRPIQQTQMVEPSEFGFTSQALQNLLGYQPPQLQAPAEFGAVGRGLQDILGYTPQQLQAPPQFEQAGDILTRIAGLQPQQFQLPIEDIQRALQAQQGIDLEQYQKQIRPVLARQGQLDSTYYANLLGDFLKGQQAQTYGTTADLLTQQALQNAQLQQFLPQLQAGAAQQLAGLGGQQAGIGQFNIAQQQAIPQLQLAALNQMMGLGGQQAGIGQFNIGQQMFTPQFQQNLLNQIAGLGGQRAGIQQYNVDLANQLQQFMPQFQAGLAGQLTGIGQTRLQPQQFNLQYPFQTYIPALQQQFQTGLGQAGQQFGAAMIPYQQQLQDYQQGQQFWQDLGKLAINKLMGGGGSMGGGSMIQGGVGGQTFNTPQFGQTWSPYR